MSDNETALQELRAKVEGLRMRPSSNPYSAFISRATREYSQGQKIFIMHRPCKLDGHEYKRYEEIDLSKMDSPRIEKLFQEGYFESYAGFVEAQQFNELRKALDRAEFLKLSLESAEKKQVAATDAEKNLAAMIKEEKANAKTASEAAADFKQQLEAHLAGLHLSG